MPHREPVDDETANCRAVRAKPAAAAAMLIVDDMTVVEDEVALLRRVTASVDHVDARAAVKEQDLRQMRMLVQTARHIRRLRTHVADIGKGRNGGFLKGRAIIAFRKILEHGNPLSS